MAWEVVSNFVVGERLDKALAAAYPKYSRSSLEKLIQTGSVLVGKEKKNSSYRLKSGDEVSVDLSPFQIQNPKIKIPVLYEDDDVIVLDKPAGVLTHAKGTFNAEATVATFIQPYLNGGNEWKSSNRAGIVHRLDRGTSGVILCAKTESAQNFMQKQFAKRNVKKTYMALVEGAVADPNGLIDVPIERSPKMPSLFRAGANGKTAQTYFTVIKKTPGHTLLELAPTTGRTHQLRVHLAYIKHPIVGDIVYGAKPAERIMLHAWKLELTLPSKARKTFIAIPPLGLGG